MGKGDRIAFWTDIWCGSRPLKNLYPTVYLMAENHLAKAAEYMEVNANGVSWDPILRRNAYNWKIPQICSLLGRLIVESIPFNQADER